ncbi:helix-turn-helix domain-containing protein [Streptomyces sp. NPDC006923]|uniref:AraC-like ligand-binding domain-containing protein n=1 Tax=Streptomyces sp. NPDC006923 TaxID=3155355 RepID=UPI0033D4BADE
MTIVVSTAPLPVPERRELWHEAVSRAFVPLDVNLLEKEPSPGTISSQRLGPLQISTVEAGPQVVTRSKRKISQDGKECLIVSLQERGASIKEQDGREALINPGEFSISDSSRLFRKKCLDEFRFVSFHFPREALRVREDDLRALTATAFSGTEGVAALVATYFARMAREAANFDDIVGRQVATTALEMLAMLVDERRGRFTFETPETASAALLRVKDYILRNLSDPDLSPPGIAAAHFISVRYVHKLFQLEGVTLGGWIRTQRLERCRQDLLRPRARELGVAAIARRWGFVSASHFSRVFRAAYGMTPRDWQVHGLFGEDRTAPGA